MRIRLNSLLVQNQEEALSFYTEVLGFKKGADFPVGEFRWLTVGSPDDPDGAELALEPNVYPAAATYQSALFEAGIPLTAFAVDDVEKEHQRLTELGVVFRSEPTEVCGEIVAVFEDTCGNLIQIYQASSR